MLSEAVGAVRARAGCDFDYIQMQGLCEQALAMGSSAACAAGTGPLHAAAAPGGPAAAADGGQPEAAPLGIGGLQISSQACRARAPGGQGAVPVGEGAPSQFWLVPRPEAHVCSCSDFLDVPAAGAAAMANPDPNPTHRGGLARATLLPLTNEFSMDQQYLCDRTGRVYLRVGASAATMLAGVSCFSGSACATVQGASSCAGMQVL